MFAVVFPGQGSQLPGMASDIAGSSAAARRVIEEADEAFGGGLAKLIAEGPEAELARTEITQPAILTASIAIWRALEERLPAPPLRFAGHSLGEYSALVAAGALPLAAAVRLVRRRGAFMQAAVPEGEGAMAAVMGLDAEAIAEICARQSGAVSPANYNSPVQTVIAGARDAVAAASEALQAAGAKRVVPLAVSAPFHCELMAPAADKLRPELDAAPFSDFEIPVVSNVTAAEYRGAAEARELLYRQVCSPVRWVECATSLRDAGARLQLEVGPGKVLSGLAAKIDRAWPRANVAELGDIESALERVGAACGEGGA